jgi:hypothetical protein
MALDKLTMRTISLLNFCGVKLERFKRQKAVKMKKTEVNKIKNPTIKTRKVCQVTLLEVCII